jgi:hypothetical protein
VHLHFSLGFAKSLPGKYFEGKIDSRCIESIEAISKIYAEGILRVKTPGFVDKCVSKITIYASIAFLISVSQIASSDMTADA